MYSSTAPELPDENCITLLHAVFMFGAIRIPDIDARQSLLGTANMKPLCANGGDGVVYFARRRVPNKVYQRPNK